MWPPDDELLRAWRQLCGDPITSEATFVGLVLAGLTADLAARERSAAADDVSTAASDAVLAFLRRPEAYDPERLPLPRYLVHIARCRLRNQFAAERRHQRGRIPWDCVELDLPARNEEVEGGPTLDAPELRAVTDALPEGERRVWELMREGERATATYALALGIAGRSAAEQEAEVKRVKDKIKARLKRAAGGMS